MTVPLRTGVRTSTVSAEWTVWDTRCRLVVTDPWALRRAREVLEAELTVVDRLAGPRRRRSPAMRSGQHGDGRVELPGGGAAALDPFPYGLASAPPGAQAHLTAPEPWQLAVDAASCGRDGRHLDPGPSVPAWAAQRCADAVAEVTSCGALVSLGGDVATSGLAPVGGWRIEVCDVPESAPVVVAVDGGAISRLVVERTGNPRRRADLHRLVVPATGRLVVPAWWAVTVAAATGPAASAACAGAMIRGTSAVGWLAGLGLPARLVDPGGAVHTVGGWPVAA